MLDTLKTLLKSKKFLVACVAVAVWAGGKIGWSIDNDQLLGAVTPLWAYIIGQGIADAKKLPA